MRWYSYKKPYVFASLLGIAVQTQVIAEFFIKWSQLMYSNSQLTCIICCTHSQHLSVYIFARFARSSLWYSNAKEAMASLMNLENSSILDFVASHLKLQRIFRYSELKLASLDFFNSCRPRWEIPSIWTSLPFSPYQERNRQQEENSWQNVSMTAGKLLWEGEQLL